MMMVRPGAAGWQAGWRVIVSPFDIICNDIHNTCLESIPRAYQIANKLKMNFFFYIIHPMSLTRLTRLQTPDILL